MNLSSGRTKFGPCAQTDVSGEIYARKKAVVRSVSQNVWRRHRRAARRDDVSPARKGCTEEREFVALKASHKGPRPDRKNQTEADVDLPTALDQTLGGSLTTSLVTGGAGFLGSHLCDALVWRGQRVIGVDNLETGSLRTVDDIRDSRFAHVNCDITEPFFVEESVDFVYHQPEVEIRQGLNRTLEVGRAERAGVAQAASVVA